MKTLNYKFILDPDLNDEDSDSEELDELNEEEIELECKESVYEDD